MLSNLQHVTNMKKPAKYLILISLIVGLVNLPPLRGLCDWLLDTYHYEFANSSGDFYIMAPSAEDFEGVNQRWDQYLKKGNVLPNDTTLYRLFSINPVAFWRYYNYFNPIYKLPYKDKDEIPKIESN
ncbi:hypothetical protein D7322_23170 [Sphingobacterium puteale]|uniref:Uncharacterized protein n=1 Tax=Sphingobacterium puteale TaxID=2420510 RepID=A0A420VSD8_9SPHI|nr:hypothetical protein D7322_23170 [Sphingobacterium puteale]